MKYLGIIIIIIAAIFGYIMFFSGSGESDMANLKNNNQKGEDMNKEDSFVPVPPAEQPEVAGEVVVLETNRGDIKINLDRQNAPVTTNNFAYLASNGFYDGVVFHRVIPDFMIQGGDPLGNGSGGPGYKFADEIHSENRNVVGTISMANAGPNTNGSQFFINVADNNFLDQKHTVFGQVIEGMDVVRAISTTETDDTDRPTAPVIIEKAYIESAQN